LRVLQEQEFEPVGSSRTLKVDVRVVAATNRDLVADSRAGRFRADLFYRLNVFPIELPPLRERRDDIEMLAEHFMRRMARKLGKPLVGIDPESLRALKAYPWPGNIRDLQNTIERAAVLTSGTLLRIDWNLDLRQEATAAVNGNASQPQSDSPDEPHAAEPQSMQAMERGHIIAILKKTHGVIEGPKGAARLLNMNASTTRFRMKKLGITRADYSADGDC
jgi:formate hydrogenlyase transcriptional activator